MKIQRVYVDTSVIGGCLDPEYAVWSEGLMRDFSDRIFRPVTSDVVQAEIDLAPVLIHQKYADLLGMKPELLTVTPAALELANTYQVQGVLTPQIYSPREVTTYDENSE